MEAHILAIVSSSIAYCRAIKTTLQIQLGGLNDLGGWLKSNDQTDWIKVSIGFQVFPEEAEGSDRILNQLMYLPPPKSYPKDQESSSAPLKLILLWNGIGSWGGIRQGRGVFLKEKCPISTCAISSSRLDSQKADLVLFKDHFTMPSFSRPTRYSKSISYFPCE